MARKPKDDTPPGGWDCPAVDGKLDPRPATMVAVGTRKIRNGPLVWVWKPVELTPTVRVRTRKNSEPGCKNSA
jgi:hypothetical protein